MSYRKANEELKFDVRMRQINLQQKRVSAEEVSSYEASLQDSSANAESLSMDEDFMTETPVREQAPAVDNNTFGGMNSGNSGFGGGFNF